MIRSMTAYARREIKNTWGSAIWEMRSLNHRYLEIFSHIPEPFRYLEPMIRERIRASLTRGKIECSLLFEPNINMQKKIFLNKKLAKQLINAAKWIKMQSKEGDINLFDILKWPGVISTDKHNTDIVESEIISVFELAMDDFIISREKEGLALKNMIEQHLKNMSVEVAKVRAYMPEIIQWQRKRIFDKLKENEIQIENNRLEQELVLTIQRTDISEEIDRLEIHIKEVFNILKNKNIAGRHLDFMMQELNRESNTLASKYINTETTNSAIELKLLIEQIREQVQNIE